MFKMRRLSLLLPMLLLQACSGNNMGELRDYVATIKARPPGHIKPIPQPKPYETFVYQASDQRDPFQEYRDLEPEVAMLGESEGNGLKPDLNRPKELLEEYPLDSLRMVGTLEQSGQRWALIQSNDGAIHRVLAGNYLGQNFGRVDRVADNAIEITEIVPDGLGGWRERPATLALSE